MSITAERKSALINQYGLKVGDTGSPEVQVAILHQRITNLTGHFKTHLKDNHSRRGLLKMVSQRRTLLDYVKKQDEARYKTLYRAFGHPPLRPSPTQTERLISGVPFIRPGDGAAEALYPMREPRVMAGSQAAGVRPAACRLADDELDRRAAWAAGFRILNSRRMKTNV